MKEGRNNPAEEIGEEILEEIVLGLPVKSIARFSCVSKSWRFIIFNSRFIKRHRCRAHEKILVAPSFYTRGIIERYSGYLSSKTTSIEYTNVSPPLVKKRALVLAHCDGLFCVLVDGELFLWNPTTTTCKQLPPPTISLLQVPPNQFLYGLGYDSIGDDYKLLLMQIENEKDKNVELYSLKSNFWKKIPSFHKSIRVKYPDCAFVNGALHWVDFPGVVVSFSLSTGEFVEFVAPKYDSIPNIVKVSVLKGKLCLTQRYRGAKFVLWLMEDYGIGTSWVKLVEIDYNKSLWPYFIGI